MAVQLGFAAASAGGSTLAATAVTGDALIALVGAIVTASLTFAGVVVATRRKRTEPAAPRAVKDVVTIPRRRYDELVRAEERDRLHTEEQALLRELREDR